jgi:CHAT domain-containing protein/tetratricopeptide (TPR) repeat protein
MARNYNEQNAVRQYLLKQLSDADQQAFEFRLLTEDALSEELEIVEDELIDEYLAEELSKVERTSFEETFLAHPERLRKLKGSQALKRYVDTRSPPKSARRPFEFLKNWIISYVPGGRGELVASPIGAMLALLVVAAGGFVVWRMVIYQSDLTKGLVALNQAYRQQRPLEVRISDIEHAPFIATRSNEPPPVNSFERDRAQRFLSDAFKEDADADSYHALGKFYLLERDIDKAIEYLEQARNAGPNNAQIYADLGAAYLEKAKHELEVEKPDGPGQDGKGLEHLGRSLEYLKQALELNPDLLEALFNRALVHEYQGLYFQAVADWRAYLEKDPNSQWAVEARERLTSLENKKAVGSQKTGDALETFLRVYETHDDEAAWKIYTRNYATTGNGITRELLDDFLAEKPRRNSTVNLQALDYLGQLEIRRTQDAYTSDLARYYSTAAPQTKALLVQARQHMSKAVKLMNGSEIAAATESLLEARSMFEKAGNVPELLIADSVIAHAAALQPANAEGLEVLARAIPVCESRRYKWLLARNLWLQSFINSNLINFSEAIGESSRALQLFQELEDSTNVSKTFLQLASLHLYVNDTETSFSFFRRALISAELQRGPPTEAAWGIHTGTSLTLTAVKLYRAALDYQNEALAIALRSGTPLLISRSYQYIGLTYGFLKQSELALQNIRLAYEQGKPRANEAVGQNMMASSSLYLGDLYRASGDPNSALDAYDESSRLYEGLRFGHYSYAAHKGKFLSHLALNNDAMAQQELQIVLGLFDQYREKIYEERQKNLFFDRAQDIYDLAIDFTYFRLGDPHRAFDYSEICRARNLRELMHHGTELMQSASGLNLRPAKDVDSQKVSPLTGAEIQQRLPHQVQVVQYAVLEKRLLIWHVTKQHGVIPKTVEVESENLKGLVETTLRQIAQRDEEGSAASLKSLYKLVIEPIREKLDPKLVLCFIPDKTLHRVPFGALLSDTSGRYLVQDYRIMTSPSATVLIDSTNRAGASVKEERLLAVGNPAFDRAVNPKLSNLPGARREVEELAANYISPRILVASQATRSSVMDEMLRADIAHFAAHYEVDPRSPLSSKLLLASDPQEPAHHQQAGLSAGDIYGMNLARTKLVILAGCKTGIEQQFSGEGPVGFARSFLVAGVPVVVASLWPVDSDATSRLMIAFHRLRKAKHLPTTEALMRAQQEIMAREHYRHPYYWAGFTAMGGYSEF